MPIRSSDWETGDHVGAPKASIRSELLDFLEANADAAYHRRELSDEILGTEWASFHEVVDDNPSMLDYYENDPDAEYNLHDVIVHDSNVELLRGILDTLVDEGYVEVRDVPLADVDIPGSHGTTEYYRFVGR